MLNRKQGYLTRIRRAGFTKALTLAVGYLQFKSETALLKTFPRLAKSFSPRLRTVFVEPTSHCNLHCKMCYRGARKGGFMDYDLFTRLIDEIAAIGNINLILHIGGESLLHPRFLNMLEYTMTRKDRPKRVGFFTNGTLLTREVQEKLVKLQVDWIAISLEGLGKVHDEIRIGSNYQEIESNIRGLLEKRGNRSKPEISLALTDTGQGQGIDELVGAWVNSVDFVRISAVFNSQLQMINPEEFFSGHETETFSRCLGPCSNMAIFWNGDVVACCSNINGQDLLGNVAQDGVLPVWRGIKYRQLRYNLLTGKPEGLCFSCNTWKTGFKNHKEDFGAYQVFYYGMMKQYVKP